MPMPALETREPWASRPWRRGVGLCLFNRDGLVFVAERLDMPGAWQMPQGGIDDDESPRNAALRELEEEVGTDRADIIAEHPEWLRYDLPEPLVTQVWHGRYRGQEQRWFALRFTGKDKHIDIGGHRGAAREFARWRWAPLAEVPTLIVGFKQAIYAEVASAFEALVVPRRDWL